MPRKTQAKALTSLEAKLAARINKQQEQVQAGDTSNRLRIDRRTHQFVFNDRELGKELHVVVLGSVFENVWYSTPYQEGVQVDPTCWAVGDTPGTLGPPEDLRTRVADKCDGCPKNEWGSGGGGMRKACSNRRRVAVVPWNEAEKKPDLTDGIGILSLASKSLKPYNAYLKKVTRDLGRDTLQIVTKIQVDDEEPYEKILEPQPIEVIDDPEVLGSLLALPIDQTLEDVSYSLDPAPAETPSRTPRRSRLSR